MTIENEHPDYQIRNLTCKKEAGCYRFSWKYKEAAGFLIFFFDCRRLFDLKEAPKQMQAAGLKDAKVTGSAKKLLAAGNGWDSFKVAYLTKTDFVRDAKSFLLPVQELQKDVPYGICVYACGSDPDTREIRLYPMHSEENRCCLPVKIKPEIRYQRKLFSKDRFCILRLPRITDYRDGAVLYHVDGASSDVPLPQSCMDKELVIVVPKTANVSIKIREEDKKYYKKG